MEENTTPRRPSAAGGLMLICFGVLLGSVGNLFYLEGAPLTSSLFAVPGSILTAVGAYRAGAAEPGFYRALLFLALGLIVNQSRGYLGMEYPEISLLHYHISLLLTMGALNLAFSAAGRLLQAAGRDRLAKFSGVAVMANTLWYVLPIAGQRLMMENELMLLFLSWASWPMAILILIFLFLASRALRVKKEDSD